MLYIVGTDDELTPKLRDYVDAAQTELNRVNRIANQSLKFYKDPARPVELLLADEIHAATRLYRPMLIERHVEIKVDDRSTQPMMGFIGELRQVLVNLLINAVDASSPGTTVDCRITNIHHPKTRRPGNQLTILDRGVGL